LQKDGQKQIEHDLLPNDNERNKEKSSNRPSDRPVVIEIDRRPSVARKNNKDSSEGLQEVVEVGVRRCSSCHIDCVTIGSKLSLISEYFHAQKGVDKHHDEKQNRKAADVFEGLSNGFQKTLQFLPGFCKLENS